MVKKRTIRKSKKKKKKSLKGGSFVQGSGTNTQPQRRPKQEQVEYKDLPELNKDNINNIVELERIVREMKEKVKKLLVNQYYDKNFHDRLRMFENRIYNLGEEEAERKKKAKEAISKKKEEEKNIKQIQEAMRLLSDTKKKLNKLELNLIITDMQPLMRNDKYNIMAKGLYEYARKRLNSITGYQEVERLEPDFPLSGVAKGISNAGGGKKKNKNKSKKKTDAYRPCPSADELIRLAKKYNVAYKNKSQKQIAEYLRIRWRYMSKKEKLMIAPLISDPTWISRCRETPIKMPKSVRDVEYPMIRKKGGGKDLLTKLQIKNMQRLKQCESKAKNKSQKKKCSNEFNRRWNDYSKFLNKKSIRKGRNYADRRQYTPKQQRGIIKQFF